MKKLKKLNGGFTIIEVMIVLAIAGLILAIVFVAVPQLQRNARDNQRQNIASRIKSEMESYASNNQGIYPFGGGSSATNYAGAACNSGVTGCIQDFVGRYVSGGNLNVKDPTTGNDVITGTSANNGSPQRYAAGVVSGISTGQLYVIFGAKCSGENVAQSGPSPAQLTTRNYAIIVGLDRPGTAFCVDNG